MRTVEGVVDASLNFMNKTLKVSFEMKDEVDRISTRTVEIVNFFEPHVRVLDKETLLDSHGNIESSHKLSQESKGMKSVAIGAVLFAVGLFFPITGFPSLLLFLSAYLLAGGEVLLRAARNISRGQVFDENFLMAIATIGAFAIGEYPEGVAVMLFYQVGEYFQDMAVNKSRKSIANLMDIKIGRAHV